MKQSFCQLAHTYNPARHSLAGWWWSFKIDGMRCLWIPETKGMRVADVPFANRDRDTRDDIATGLWSRLGKTIFAPSSFVAQLPADICLDGELWTGAGFQETMSIVKQRNPDDRWSDIAYRVFDMPERSVLFSKRELDWETRFTNTYIGAMQRPYMEKYGKILQLLSGPIVPLFQEPIGSSSIDDLLEQALAAGHEGLVFRNPDAYYTTQRSKNLLKHKPFFDAEGIVVGVTEGTGKYTSMLGALVVETDLGQGTKTLELGSGLTDYERSIPPHEWMGTKVTYKYRALSDDGVPREGRFWRICRG